MTVITLKELFKYAGTENGFSSCLGKPHNMVAACRALENMPSDPTLVGDRSLRVLIPRTLLALYEIRNNRGVGHVGGDVSANHMDAEVVLAMASWVMAELVRIFHSVSTAEAQDIVDALVERRSPAIWDVGGVKRVLDPSMSSSSGRLRLLAIPPSFTHTSQISALRDSWGN